VAAAPAPSTEIIWGMLITFENHHDVIVYGLEKVISYSRAQQPIFVAQRVWWLASITGPKQGLLVHINNVQAEIKQEQSKALRDRLTDSGSYILPSQIHPDRIP
jgi:hypothetical protein